MAKHTFEHEAVGGSVEEVAFDSLRQRARALMAPLSVLAGLLVFAGCDRPSEQQEQEIERASAALSESSALALPEKTCPLVRPVGSRLSYLGPATMRCSDRSPLKAGLVTEDGVAMAGRTVQLDLAALALAATTDDDGIATVALENPLAPGDYPIGLSFAGDAELAAATGSGTLLVRQVATRLRLVGTTFLEAGRTDVVEAILVDEDGTPLAGRTVTFTAFGQTVSAETDAAGTAKASLAGLPASSTGPSSVTASFAGDACFAPSSDQGQRLRYAATGFAIWGGNTTPPAIGDLLNFWGHSWWNQVTAGDYDVHAEFKGYAGELAAYSLCQAAARVGGTPALEPGCWLSKPGQSFPPSPLPTYIGVIVPTSITKTQDNIFGNVAALAILRVEVQPEFGPVPGKPGWGTLVAVIESGAVLAPRPSLSAIQTQPATVLPGQELLIQLAISNSSSATAGAVTVEESIQGASPSSFSRSLGDMTAGASATESFTVSTASVPARLADETSAAYGARLALVDGQRIRAAARVRYADASGASPAAVDAISTSQVVVPRLVVRLSAPAEVQPGMAIPYTITVRNVGSAIARAVSAGVTLPDGSSTTLEIGAIEPGMGTARTVSWTVPTIPLRGAEESAGDYLARLNAFVQRGYSAGVAVTWQDAMGHPYGAIEATTTSCASLPILSATVAQLDAVLPGQVFPVTFTVTNVGSARASNGRIALPGGASSEPFTLAPGESTTVTLSTTAPPIGPRGGGEIEGVYLGRLVAADGSLFSIPFDLTWQNEAGATFGAISDRTGTALILPITPLALQGPTQAQAGDVLSFEAVLSNSGHATAVAAMLTIAWPDGTTSSPPLAATPIPPGGVLRIPLSWTVPRTLAPGSFFVSGAVTWIDALGGAYGPLSALAPITILRSNEPPVVEAGPDQAITLPAWAHLQGSVTDDGLPEGASLTSSWVQVSGPGTAIFLDAESPETDVIFDVPGTYVLRLTGSDSQLTASDQMQVVVAPRTGSGGTVVGGQPAPGESLVNLVREGNALRLDNETKPFNFIWVAVSSKGTIVKINTRTGAVLGEYWSSPDWQPKDPSRTTVDHNGNVWATNRAGNSVVRIGLVENGQCIDRNGNGVIDTSTGIRDVRPWTNAGNADTNGGVKTAQDECIINYVRVTARGTRHVSVDSNNDVWVSGYDGTRAFDLLDGVTGVIKRTEGPAPGNYYGGYGGLIDRNGVIWSANRLLRWDTAKPLNGNNGVNWKGWDHDSYGLCIDPEGNVWNTSLYGGVIRKFSPSGSLLGMYSHGYSNAQGCVADKRGHIWVAHVLWGSATVGHVKPDGSFVGNVPVQSGPTGVAVDADGKIWATNHYAGTVSRINPDLGPVGPDGSTHVGAVDLTSQYLGGYLYNYSDMTGSTLTGAPTTGTWSFVWDSQRDGATWGKLQWNGHVCGDSSLKVTVASSTNGTTFSTPVAVTNGAAFSVPNGRYLKVSVAFKRSTKGQSPMLYDLQVATADYVLSPPSNQPPGVNAGLDRATTVPNPIKLTGSACDDGHLNSGPLAMTWSKVSGPGEVTFKSPNAEATELDVTQTGTYVLRLTAGDSELVASDDITLDVLAANRPPVVKATTPVSANLPGPIQLTATVTDDGLPQGSTLTIGWSKVSGPGTATFADPEQASTTVTLSAPGLYVLRLVASDGHFDSTADVTVLANGGPAANLAPIVSAGENQTIALDGTAALPGTCTDDGMPAGKALTCTWTKVSGPGFVTFANPSAASTTATFSVTGTYVLRLTGTDTELSASGEIAVAVGEEGATNRPPLVYAGPNRAISLPSTIATLEGTAADDGYPVSSSLSVTWSKISGPAEVIFQNEHAAATLALVPTAGTYLLRLTGTDGQLSSTSEVLVTVSPAPAANQAPQVTLPVPFEMVLPSRIATLTGTATDDGLPTGATLALTWRQVSGPQGVVFGTPNAATTTVTLPAVPGVFVISLTATDSILTTSTQTSITLRAAGTANMAPTVSAGPNRTISLLDVPFALAGQVSDDGQPTGAPLTSEWKQVSGPAAVTFADAGNPTTTVSFPLPGDYELALWASDTEWQSAANVIFHVLPAVANEPPKVLATGPAEVSLATGTGSLVGAVQDDGLPASGTLTVTWSMVSGPADVGFADAHQVATTATFSTAGDYVLELSANDGAAQATAQISIRVTVPNTPPQVSAGPPQVLTFPARVAQLVGTATDDGLPSSKTLTVNWSLVDGPGSVQITDPASLATAVGFNFPGTYVLRLTASDGELSTSSDTTVSVGATPGGLPVVSLTSPADGSKLTTVTDVIGSVSEGDWKVDYRLGGEDSEATWVSFGSGSGAVAGGVVGRLDTTMMLNGIYAIRLSAITSGGQASAVINVSVERNLKVGNFTVSFNDLTVPVAGLPIEVIRTYDSRDKSAGDFGVGWNVSLRNIRVETSGVLGKSWQQQLQPGFFPTYCLVQSRPRFATVTFPTGKVQRFRTTTSPDCEVFRQVDMVELAFEPEPGTYGTLSATSGSALIATEGMLLDDNGRVFDPSSFQFTSQDGTVYNIEKKKGLTWMQDRNGNTVAVSAAGVIHSAGKSITFERDSSGRITKMTDPTGSALRYEYNASGDLVAAVDREGNRTTYDYDTDHGLLKIVDPLGKPAIRNEYDPDGRLVKNIDAYGREIVYTHKLAENQEEITDRTGAVRLLTYDHDGNVVAEVNAENELTTRVFDDDDNRTSETDPLTHTTGWKYENGNMTEMTDPLQKKTTYTYNGFGQLETTTDPLTHATTNRYDPNNGNLLETKDALLHSTTFTYDPQGNRKSRTDRLSRPTSYGYDQFGNLTSETDALANVTSYTYDGNGNRLTETRKRTKADGTQESLVTRFTYDKNGRLLSTTQPDGSVTSSTYNAAGLRDTSTDALGRVTQYAYDDQGQLLSTLYPDGTSTSSTYDEEGRRLTSKDRSGRTTTMEYDRVGRLKKTIYPDQTYSSTEYYADGRVKSTKDPGGHVTSYEYDAAGRQTKVTDAKDKSTSFTYDDAGNQVTATDARTNTTRSVYDALNRLVQTIFVDESSRSTTYDAEGQRIVETDQAGKTTGFGYDRLGRLETVTDALTQVTRYGYDEVGNRISVTDAATKVTKLAYDKMGRETRRELPDGKFETKMYNNGGELTSRTDFQGRTTSYAYDRAGRLTSKTYADTSTVGFTYNASGRRKTAVDARGTTAYTYDDRDRLTAIAYPDGKRIEYGYDTEGRRTALTAKVGTTTLATGYTYDELDRIKTVTDPDTRVFSMEYDEVGSLAKLVRPNGVDTAYTHDPLNRLTNIRTYARATDTTIASYAYTLGPTGIRTKIDEADGTTKSYEYDELYRLTKETVAGPQPYENTFTYDAVSNRKTQNGTTYTYDNRDRLTSEGGTVYSWSENGNLVGKTGEATYEWDFEDRLVRVVKGDGTVVENVYDVDGVLVRTAVNGVGVDYLVDTSGGLSHVVAEVGSGDVEVVYVRAGDMLLEEIRGGVAKMYEADGLGSVRGLLDASGARTDSYVYEAFGSTVSTTGNDLNPYRFAGERWMGDVGMYQNRARWLDTRVGRFVSVDPLVSQTGGPYLYGDNTPATLTDPTGESPTLVGLMVSVITYFALEGAVARAEDQAATVRLHEPQVSIGIEANGGKKAYGGGIHRPIRGDWGHVYIRAVNTDAKVYIFSFGPGGSATERATAFSLNPAYATVPGRADWPLKDKSSVEYVFRTATNAQFEKGIAMIKKRFPSPGPFSMRRNCTSEAVEIAREGFGLDVPDGRGTVDLGYGFGAYSNVPNPYKLNDQLRTAGHVPVKISAEGIVTRNGEIETMSTRL